jgi:hypothetical protein
VRGPLVEVREAEEEGGRQQRAIAAESRLKQILHPSAKEQLFRDGDKEKREQKHFREVQRTRPNRMEVEKAERQAKGDRDRRIEKELSQADLHVA